MSLAQLKKELAEIRDKAIDNVDKHFHEYISTDLQETGDEDYFLVDSLSHSLHWMSMLGELKPIMDELKDELFREEASPELQAVWNESVKLKIVIDQNIMKYEAARKIVQAVDHYYVFNFIGLDLKPPKKPEPISFRISEEGIKELHNGLKRRFGYIDVSYKEFIEHTKPSETDYELIRWKSLDLDLVMFILLLVKHKVIPERYSRPKYQIEFICMHFQNEENKPFNPNSIATQLRRMKDYVDSITYKPLDDLIAVL